jgi:hypothetical protein
MTCSRAHITRSQDNDKSILVPGPYSRELLDENIMALSNYIRGLLMEFGIVISRDFAALRQRIPEVLEDGENELPDLYRPTLHLISGG